MASDQPFVKAARGRTVAPLTHLNAFLVDLLPVELTSRIFLHFACGCSVTESPLILGAVCQTWRAIAWSTPEVWANLTIATLASSISETRVQLAEEWLNRSGAFPLSIKLECPFLETPDTSPFLLHRLIDIVNDHADQWQYLNFTLPKKLLSRLDDSKALTSGVLREMSFVCSDSKDIIIEGISHVSPEIIDFRFPLRDLSSLRWESVTQVTVGLPSVDYLFRILQTAPNLRKCKFTVFFGSGAVLSEKPHGSITHPLIESLDIGFSFGKSAESVFLARTFLPSMEQFCLRGKSTGSILDVFVSFLTRSPKLRGLKLEDSSLGGEELIRIARATPSLERLQVGFYSVIEKGLLDPFYLALARQDLPHGNSADEPPEPLLPLLQELEMLDVPDFPWDILPRYFVSLSREGPRRIRPLRLVSIRCLCCEGIPYIGKSVLDQLSALSGRVHFDFKAYSSHLSGDLWQMSLDHINGTRAQENPEEDDLRLDMLSTLNDLLDF